MRKLTTLAAALVMTVALSSIASAATPVPPQSRAVQMQSGSVRFIVQSVEGAPTPDERTAFLDQVLAEWGWPGTNTMLLLHFPEANNDIRFAMGPGFRQNGLTVDEMLKLVRGKYLPAAHSGDIEGALKGLMQAISQRMGSTDTEVTVVPATEAPATDAPATDAPATDAPAKDTATTDAPTTNNDAPLSEAVIKTGVNKTWALLRQGDAKALAATASDKMTGELGVVIAPLAKDLANPPIAGEALEQTLAAMLDGAQPEVVAYRSIESQILLMVKGLNPVEVTPEGGSPVKLTDLVQFAIDRAEDGSWKLLYIATDNGNFAETIKSADWVAPEAP